jgi:hypothetical protein
MPNLMKSPNPLVQFRCPTDDAELFYRNVARMSWRKDDVLRELVKAANRLFAAVSKPEMPFILGDSAVGMPEVSSSPKERDDLKLFLQELFAQQKEEVRLLAASVARSKGAARGFVRDEKKRAGGKRPQRHGPTRR